METRTKVVVINGVPKSGKDTFIGYAKQYCDMVENANVLNISSVDPIKDMLRSFGWDGNKTDNIRDIIVRVKQVWVDAQNGPTMFLINNIINFHTAHPMEDNIVFCHVREPEEINKLCKALNGFNVMGIDIMTLFINRNTNSTGANVTDADNPYIISDYPYDVIINNNEGLIRLEREAIEFVDKILED